MFVHVTLSCQPKAVKATVWFRFAFHYWLLRRDIVGHMCVLRMEFFSCVCPFAPWFVLSLVCRKLTDFYLRCLTRVPSPGNADAPPGPLPYKTEWGGPLLRWHLTPVDFLSGVSGVMGPRWTRPLIITLSPSPPHNLPVAEVFAMQIFLKAYAISHEGWVLPAVSHSDGQLTLSIGLCFLWSEATSSAGHRLLGRAGGKHCLCVWGVWLSSGLWIYLIFRPGYISEEQQGNYLY